MLTPTLAVAALVAGLAASSTTPTQEVRGEREILESRLHELEIHAEQLQGRLADLRSAGKREEARDVQRQLAEVEEQLHRLRDESEVHQVERRLDEMRSEIQELRAAGRHDNADLLQREAAELRHELGARHERVEMNEVKRRLHHLMQAAEHLHAADAHDWVEEVKGRIEELKHELESRGHHERDRLEGHIAELTEAFRMLRSEVRELRGHVEQLTE